MAGESAPGRHHVSAATLAAVTGAVAAGASSPGAIAERTGKSARTVGYAVSELRRRRILVGGQRSLRLASSKRLAPPSKRSTSATASRQRPRVRPQRPRVSALPPAAAMPPAFPLLPPAASAPPPTGRRRAESSSVHAAAHPVTNSGRRDELEAAAALGIAPPLPMPEEPSPAGKHEPAGIGDLLGGLAYALAGAPLGQSFAPRQSSAISSRPG
jgi:hypothetical protein